MLNKNQMGGARNGQELGQPLDRAQENRFGDRQASSARPPEISARMERISAGIFEKPVDALCKTARSVAGYSSPRSLSANWRAFSAWGDSMAS